MYRLMIVDDEYYIRQMLVASVDWAAIGYEVCCEAEDGLGALAMVEQHRVDAALVDINVPKLSGLDLIERIAQHHPGVQVVILSAYDKFSYAQRAVRMGVFEYLLKPVDPEQVAATFVRLQSRLARMQQEREAADACAEGGGMSRLVWAVRRDIQGNFEDESLSLSALSERHHVHQSYLSRAYKQIMGRTVIEDLIETRLSAARIHMERDRAASIAQIARSAGYSDPLYFSKAFKKRYGISPQQCRINNFHT